jgi:hypothetical protein
MSAFITAGHAQTVDELQAMLVQPTKTRNSNYLLYSYLSYHECDNIPDVATGATWRASASVRLPADPVTARTPLMIMELVRIRKKRKASAAGKRLPPHNTVNEAHDLHSRLTYYSSRLPK